VIVGFADKDWEDYLDWQENNKKILKRINTLLEDITRNPYDSNGIGKPKRLKSNLEKYFSRRITAEHRIIYKSMDGLVIVAQCRFHY
jgi:toxin YoeB